VAVEGPQVAEAGPATPAVLFKDALAVQAGAAGMAGAAMAGVADLVELVLEAGVCTAASFPGRHDGHNMRNNPFGRVRSGWIRRGGR